MQAANNALERTGSTGEERAVSDIEATADKYLRDKYAIIGVGETTYTRGSGMTTRALGTWAIKNAMDDAGIPAASPALAPRRT